jgi:lysophospholipid acyltransferase (LPLAT)-like uncharacterized protein
VVRRIELFLIAFSVASFYWLLSRFWRLREEGPGPSDPSPKLYAHWHGDELLLIRVCIHRRMAIMASRSKDGELMKRVLEFYGFRVVRGSSTRGGAAGLKGLIDVMKSGKYHSSLAVDGPRGPRFKVKPGILKLAQETGLPIIPGVAASSKRFVFKKSWNQCYLPLPFARCEVIYGEPIKVPKELTEVEFEFLRQTLENRLLKLKAEVESRFERKFEFPEGIQPAVFSGV